MIINKDGGTDNSKFRSTLRMIESTGFKKYQSYKQRNKKMLEDLLTQKESKLNSILENNIKAVVNVNDDDDGNTEDTLGSNTMMSTTMYIE